MVHVTHLKLVKMKDNSRTDNVYKLGSFASEVFSELAKDKSYEHPFFLIEIMKRRKDNPTLEVPYKTMKWFVVYSEQELYDYCKPSGEIYKYCAETNSRAYFHVNAKDSRQTANAMLCLISKWSNPNYNTLELLPNCFYLAARQQESNVKNKYWVLDFDYQDDFKFSEDDKTILLESISPEDPPAFYEDGFILSVKTEMLKIITYALPQAQKDFLNSKAFTVKTNHGFHIVIPPFDLYEEIKKAAFDLRFKIQDYDYDHIVKNEKLMDRLKKNNSTLLMMPPSKD